MPSPLFFSTKGGLFVGDLLHKGNNMSFIDIDNPLLTKRPEVTHMLKINSGGACYLAKTYWEGKCNTLDLIEIQFDEETYGLRFRLGTGTRTLKKGSFSIFPRIAKMIVDHFNPDGPLNRRSNTRSAAFMIDLREDGWTYATPVEERKQNAD